MLIMSDHGAGWPGGLSDPDPGGPGPDKIVLAKALASMLWLMEIDQGADRGRNKTLGLDHFDVIAFDACLMSQLEVYNALAPHALYAVASEEKSPALALPTPAFSKTWMITRTGTAWI